MRILKLTVAVCGLLMLAATLCPAETKDAPTTRPAMLRLSCGVEVMWDPSGMDIPDRFLASQVKAFAEEYENIDMKIINDKVGFVDIPLASEADGAKTLQANPRSLAVEAARRGWRLGMFVATGEVPYPRDELVKKWREKPFRASRGGPMVPGAVPYGRRPSGMSGRGDMWVPDELLLEVEAPGVERDVRIMLAQPMSDFLASAERRATEYMHASITEDQLSKMNDVFNELRKARSELKESRAAGQQRTTELKSKKEDMEVDLLAKEARLKGMAVQIARLTRQGEANAADDAVVKEMEDIVRLRRDRIKALTQLMAARKATQADVQEAEIELREAVIRLALRKEAVRNAVGAELLTRLNNEQVLAGIDLKEMQARQDYYRTQLRKIAADLEKAEQHIAKLERQREALVPFKVGGAFIDVRAAEKEENSE